MIKTAGHILKGSNTELAGQVHLNLANAGQTPKGKNTASDVPQVYIVENHPDFVVMEITCSCGAKTYLRCEYAESSAEQMVGQTK